MNVPTVSTNRLNSDDDSSNSDCSFKLPENDNSSTSSNRESLSSLLTDIHIEDVDAMNITSSNMKEKRSVQWSDITFYQFPNMLGDNPAASSEGAPITMEWNHTARSIIDVDYYEYLITRQPRRTRKQLVMKGPERDT